MSLSVNSSSRSDEEDDINTSEREEEIENDIEELSMSDEDFESLSEEDFAEVDKTLGDEDNEDDESEMVNDDETTATAVDDGSEHTEEDEETEDDQPNERIENQPGNDKAYDEAFQLLYGKPVKASGREVQLRNPEHAMNFIEMGIDYNKKMHSMKPHLRTLKTLEKEGLLEAGKEERLNLLIEVEKGNKDALKRFIAESDMDPLDLADDSVIEEGRNYRPQNHMISEQEVEIEEALSAIEGSPSQQRTIDVMTKQFDAKSRQVISENPRYIVALNQDIENGIYDEVMEAVQYRKDMKQVRHGISDMELYIETVEEMTRTKVQEEAQNQPPQYENEVVQNKPRNSSNRRRKVAMSGSKSSNKPKKREYDPMEILSMNDEEFEKSMGMDAL